MKVGDTVKWVAAPVYVGPFGGTCAIKTGDVRTVVSVLDCGTKVWLSRPEGEGGIFGAVKISELELLR